MYFEAFKQGVFVVGVVLLAGASFMLRGMGNQMLKGSTYIDEHLPL